MCLHVLYPANKSHLTSCSQTTCHPLLWSAPHVSRGAPTAFEFSPARPALAFLGDHRVAAQSILPTAALLEMAAAAAKVCMQLSGLSMLQLLVAAAVRRWHSTVLAAAPCLASAVNQRRHTSQLQLAAGDLTAGDLLMLDHLKQWMH